MPRSEFENLPFELKLQVIEHEPYTLRTLIYVDKELLQYINTEQGKTWLRRIAGVQINTEYEKGMLLFGTIKDGQWEYYTESVRSILDVVNNIYHKPRLVKIEKYDTGNLYETIMYFPEADQQLVRGIIPMKNGIRDGVTIEYYLKPYTMATETLYENGELKTEKRYEFGSGILERTLEHIGKDTYRRTIYNKDGTIRYYEDLKMRF